MPQDTTALPASARQRSGRLPLVVSAATALGSLGLLGLAEGCRFEPRRPVVHFSLSHETRAVDEDGVPKIPLAVQDQIQGSLEMLFGTPSHPQYLLLTEWIDKSFDPNWPTYAVGDMGSGEFDEEDVASFAVGNKRRMRLQLAAIADGRYEDVTAPDHAPDLEEKWADMLAGTAPEARGADFQIEARDLFENWYPTLRDSAELYRQECLHCHGPEGGGNGPTADFVKPRPRDYRLGIFKFTPMLNKAVPRRRDLLHILDQGVTGTAMPSFRRFSRAELEGLVDYVRLLSMRGMVEHDLFGTYDIKGALPAEQVLVSYTDVFEKWQRSEAEAEELVIAWDGEVPHPTPESVAKGRELYMSATKGNCFSCHGESGRGDGVAAFKVDPETGVVSEAYNDDWGVPIRPRNLTQGLLGGGRRPIDIFRRVKAGINGTPMPALAGVLSDEEIWSIVHFVGTVTESSLFYPEFGAHAESAEKGHH
jgi:mono/diheme cytochrome c family protein